MEVALTLGQIAAHLNLELRGDENRQIDGMASLESATATELSFLANPKYRSQLKGSKAGAVILHPDLIDEFQGDCLISSNPYLSFAQATVLFDPTPSGNMQVSARASVAATASLADGVTVGDFAVIADNVSIGAGSVIGAGVHVGVGSKIGANCRIEAHVAIYHGVTIGSDVQIHANTVIGSDGFGFAPKPDGWQKISQLGGVRIGDRANIGANCTIDRGALDDTVIGDGVILDNQIHIAHNVVIGENTAMAGQSAIAGSAVVGRNCTIGGGVGIIGHLEVADNVHLTSRTLVTKSIKESGSYSSGVTMSDTATWRKNSARFNRLDEMYRRIVALEKLVPKDRDNNS